jgi:hypothetical protein
VQDVAGQIQATGQVCHGGIDGQHAAETFKQGC